MFDRSIGLVNANFCGHSQPICLWFKANAQRKLRTTTYQLQPCSTVYRHLRWATSNYAGKIKAEISESATNKVHWVLGGQFRSSFRCQWNIPWYLLLLSSSHCLLGKDLFKKTLWTAHGVKLI